MRQARRNPGKRSGCHVVHAGRGGRRKEQRSRGSDIWAEPPTLAWRRGYPFGLPASGAGASRLSRGYQMTGPAKPCPERASVIRSATLKTPQ